MDIDLLKKKYSTNTAQSKVTELEQEMAQPSPDKDISSLSADLSYYSDLAYQTSQIQKAIQDYEDTSLLIETEKDLELKEMATEELTNLEEKITTLDTTIKKLVVGREFADTDDNKSIILEIRAGAGGDEAALFAADLFRMYSNYSTHNGWEVQIITSSVTEGGGYKEVVAHIVGKNVFKNLKYESGVHRVQRIPVTESSGRIHTSTASVAIMPEAKEVDVVINPGDLKVEVMRAGGAGGQCVNRTDSAVRITHLPTGIVVSCQETKHQAQNKEKAMALLRSRLYDMKKKEEMEKRADMRLSQIGSSMRAEKIRTYNYPQTRITDHRVKLSWFNLEAILNGDLQQMIDDINNAFQEQLLEQKMEDGE